VSALAGAGWAGAGAGWAGAAAQWAGAAAQWAVAAAAAFGVFGRFEVAEFNVFFLCFAHIISTSFFLLRFVVDFGSLTPKNN